MKLQTKINHSIIFAVLISLLIISCGGEGNDSNTTSNNLTTPPVTTYDITIIRPKNDSALVDESIGLVLKAQESNISSINWIQTAGPNVSFLGKSRKVIGFDIINEAGNHTFAVSFYDAKGNPQSANYSFSVRKGQT